MLSGLGTYLSSTIRRDVIAASHHDQPHDGNHQHDDEPGDSIPQVQHLGDGHQARGAHDAGDDRNDGQQRMLGETAGDVGAQVGRQAAVEVVDEVHQPHT